MDKKLEKFIEINSAIQICNVKTTKTGDMFLVGSTISLGSGGDDIYIMKANSSGDIISQSTYGTANGEMGISLKITNDGGCIVVGSYNWIIKTDENCKVE